MRTSQSEAQKILGQKLWAFVSRGLARGKDGKWPLKETSYEVKVNKKHCDQMEAPPTPTTMLLAQNIF